MIWGSREHALYLFILCIWMKGGIISAVAIEKLTKFYEVNPEMFLPENFLELTENELSWVSDWLRVELPKYGLGVNVEESRLTWIRNIRKLACYWDSDPRKIFAKSEIRAKSAWKSYRAAKATYDTIAKILVRKSSQTPEKFLDLPTGFFGFQHKMVSMLIYFYVHAGIISSIPYPVPVDFHILRVLFATGVLKMQENKKERWGTRMWDYRERFLKCAREVTLRYVVETRCDAEHFSEALWLISQVWCWQHPGNRAQVEKSTKRKARKRRIRHPEWAWDDTNKRRYDTTCARCPVEEFCEWNIPSAYYYVKGVIKLHSRRERSAQPMLMPIDVPIRSRPNGNGIHKIPRVLPVVDPAQAALFD